MLAHPPLSLPDNNDNPNITRKSDDEWRGRILIIVFSQLKDERKGNGEGCFLYADGGTRSEGSKMADRGWRKKCERNK